MRSVQTSLIILALVSSCIGTDQDARDSVRIIERFTQDLQTSPSGYSFHHRSDSVHPGGYKADVNHGEAEIGRAKLPEANAHGNSGTYRVAGGYGFMISHDYGSQSGRIEAPRASGGGNADLASIGMLQLERSNPGGPRINVVGKIESVDPGKSEEVDGYIGNEIYGSYMEYDALVKDGKKGPSVYPGEYYESDVYDGKEKYDSDDGYDGSNNARYNGRYLESEKHDGSEDYNENEHYDVLGGGEDHGDDGETDKYVISPEHEELDDFNGQESVGLYRGYEDRENDHEKYEEPSSYGEFDDYNAQPKFDDIRNSFLDDFFKEYNEFSKGSHIQTGFKNDHEYDDDYHDDHASQDEHGLYAEGGENEEDFFDDAESDGFHHEEEDGGSEGHFGEKKGHKSGSKTTGYRNLLHKDEYTKDHTFYEHAKNNGHFDKDGDYDEHDYRDEGSHKKSGHHDHSSYDDHHGKTDSEDKGYSIEDDLSHHDEHGQKYYFDDNSDYTHDGDSRYDSEYEEGYSK